MRWYSINKKMGARLAGLLSLGLASCQAGGIAGDPSLFLTEVEAPTLDAHELRVRADSPARALYTRLDFATVAENGPEIEMRWTPRSTA